MLVALITEHELLDRAYDALHSMLPEYELRRQEHSPDQGTPVRDAVWQLEEPGGVYTELLVEAKTRFLPRDVDRVLGGMTHRVRQMMRNPTIVVVAPWLSPRARALLVERGLNYIDLTGNVSIRIRRPAVVIHTHGADRDPSPQVVPPAQLKGSRVNRIVRLLADVKPPYGVGALARAAVVNAGYVSRVLEALDEQAIIRRGRRGEVVDVEWARLLEARARNYGLLSSNSADTYVTQMSFDAILERLRQRPGDFGEVVVTGSVAAEKVAPVTAPAQLVLYTSDPGLVRTQARLLPASRGANVILIRPADISQIDRPRIVDGVAHAGLSQLAMDCLAGNGRLPEEGAAVLRVMAATEEKWRLAELPAPAEEGQPQ